MMASGAADPERFRGWIAQRLGLHFDDTKLEFLAEVLGRRTETTQLASPRYLDRLDGPGADAELQALVLELTVPETYFFRHIEQFNAFAEVALPAAVAARQSVRTLRILSVGCASGEEPYSLAILLRERGVDSSWDVGIRALDINPAMLAKAARGHYTRWALRETTPEVQGRWFRRGGQDFVLDKSIRAAVTFQQVNLSQENSDLWGPATYDVIFCRNVLMYFTERSAQAQVARMTRSLAPGGHLFLGHAETLRGLSNDYHLCHTHGTFYYRRKDAHRDERDGQPLYPPLPNGAFSRTESRPIEARAPAESSGEVSRAATWLETIQHASNRIQALSERPIGATPPPSSPDRNSSHRTHSVAAVAATQLQLALELLKQERFADALELLGPLPVDAVTDADGLLVRAALLTHSGQLDGAESVCAQLLERDELSTGAHYLLALCRESAGDRAGALRHNQAAAYLDPGFAMPRLHLGLLARRKGDLERARRELGHALLLLKREDASRLLLFGGGFGREALIALCRAELLSAGGTP